MPRVPTIIRAMARRALLVRVLAEKPRKKGLRITSELHVDCTGVREAPVATTVRVLVEAGGALEVVKSGSVVCDE
eukprot:scaffold203433_cov15-Prasinocladus_malaysianus.AAC.1